MSVSTEPGTFERVPDALPQAVAAPAPALPAAPAPAPAKPRPPAPEVIGGPPRSLTIQLEYPLGWGGREYHAITLRRPTSVEVGQFFEALVAKDEATAEDLLFFPVFFDQDGAPVPAAVLEGLDDDDRAEVMGRVSGFLPRRLQALQDASPSSFGADTGAATEPTFST